MSALLKACLNGSRAPGDHPALPVTAAQLASDARRCALAGAGAIHLHPRGPEGRESLDAAIVDPVVAEVRAASGLPVGVSTGAWIVPDPARRAAAVAAWREPAFASVNLSEPGAEDVMRALLARGIGIEAGVWSVDDVEHLRQSGLAGRVMRVLVEIVDGPADSRSRARQRSSTPWTARGSMNRA